MRSESGWLDSSSRWDRTLQSLGAVEWWGELIVIMNSWNAGGCDLGSRCKRGGESIHVAHVDESGDYL
jgi:hypothetical protein